MNDNLKASDYAAIFPRRFTPGRGYEPFDLSTCTDPAVTPGIAEYIAGLDQRRRVRLMRRANRVERTALGMTLGNWRRWQKGLPAR
jgi:hypothetical protein